MQESETNYLDIFPAWLRSLGDDSEKLADIVTAQGLPEAARQAIAGGLNYLFKALDLVPDGMDDIGFLDDAFVLRVAAEQAIREDVSDLPPDKLRLLNRLAEESKAAAQFLNKDFPRLSAYVTGLRKAAARGRSIQDILHDPKVQAAFVSDVRGFAKAYQSPSFSREEKNLVKLRAFFDAKLPK